MGAPTDGGRTEGCSHARPPGRGCGCLTWSPLAAPPPWPPWCACRAGGRGPSGVPLGTRPGPAARASCSPHRAQAGAPAVPGPCRGPRSVEPSQCGLCQDSRGGVGAAGTQPSACSCSGSSGSAEPLPFLGKVELGLPHGRPAGRRLTCQEEEGTESHPSCSQSTLWGGWRGRGHPGGDAPRAARGGAAGEGSGAPQEGVRGVRGRGSPGPQLPPRVHCPAPPKGRKSAPWDAPCLQLSQVWLSQGPRTQDSPVRPLQRGLK